MHLLQEGGPFFMYSLVFLLLIIFGLIIRGFINKNSISKTILLISSISLFALVFGFLGQILGLVGAFDAIEAVSNVSPSILASGLKISFLTTGLGSVVFLVGRFGIIILTIIRKK